MGERTTLLAMQRGWRKMVLCLTVCYKYRRDALMHILSMMVFLALDLVVCESISFLDALCFFIWIIFFYK